MAIIITKHVKIEIDGNDVATLQSICECAQRYERDHKHIEKDSRWTAEWNGQEWERIRAMMDKIFDA